jgi:hypothetical protein
MLPEDLSLVAQVMLDGVWHAPAPGSLKREGGLLVWREGTNPEAYETVTDAENVTAVMVSSKRKAEASKLKVDADAEAERHRLEQTGPRHHVKTHQPLKGGR